MSDSVPHVYWASDDKTAVIKLFKQRCELYLVIKDIKKDKQVQYILYFAGDKGLEKFNSWTMTDAQKKDPEEIWKRFIGQQISSNFRVARFYLQQYRQQEQESIDEYITRCRIQAQKCDFRDEEEFNQRIIDQLISGTRYLELQKELLKQDKNLTIEAAITLSKTHEAAMEHAQQMSSASSNNVHNIHQSRTHRPYCIACGKVGHWQTVCRATHQQDVRSKHARSDDRPRSNSRHRQRRRRNSKNKSNVH